MKRANLILVISLFLFSTPAFGLEAVKVGWIPNMGFAPFYIALEKGYFKELGLDVRLEPLPGGGDILAMVASGHFDVGGGAMSARTFNAYKTGLDFLVVSSFITEIPPLTAPLIVRKESFDKGAVRSIKDLKGKKVAVNALGVATEFTLNEALKKGGLTISDIDLVTIPFPLMPQALAGGQIEAAIAADPFATMAIKKGYGVILSGDHLPYLDAVVLYYNKDFATRRRRVAEAFMVGFLKGARDLYNKGWKSEEHIAIHAKYTKTPPEIVRDSFPPFIHPNGRLNVDNLMEQQRFLMGRGYLKYTDLIDINKMIDYSFVESALKVLGEVKNVEMGKR